MKSKGKLGQISIFLCIVIMSVFILAGVLVEASRMHSGEAVAKMAVECAAKSVLSEYGTKLEDEYGILACYSHATSENGLVDEVKDYVERNLMIGNNTIDNDRLKLYDFKVEELNVSLADNLSEDGIFMQQILEFMKYRAPKELIQGFLDKVDAFKEIGKMAEAYKQKLAIDKILAFLDKAQQRFKKQIDGSGNDDSAGICVNGFNINGSWADKLNSYSSLCSRISSARASLENAMKELAALPAETGDTDGGTGGTSSTGSTGGTSSTGDTTDSTTGSNNVSGSANGANVSTTTSDPFAQERIQYLTTIMSLQAEIDFTTAEAGDIWSTLRYSMTENFIEPNIQAQKELQSILDTGKSARDAFGGLMDFIDKNFKESGSFSDEFVTSVKEELERFDEFVAGGEKALSFMEDINDNITTLSNMTERLDSIKSLMYGSEASSDASGVIVSASGQLMALVNDYERLAFDYEKPKREETAEDPRVTAIAAARSIFPVLGGDDVNYLNEGISSEELPSHSKGQSSGANSTVSTGLFNIDLFGEESVLQGDSLGLASSIGESASDDVSAIRDNLYINEYIMGMFKNAVSGDTYFDGLKKSERDTFYDCETEYILHGNASQNVNRQLTTAQLLMLRFAMDTLHVYTDTRKKELATGIAAASAGWWTGGAGIPIVSNLIMCGWGMCEAALDVSELMDGEKIPIFKSKGDWKLDIGISSEGEKKTDDMFSMSYYDYLRVFLLITPEDDKLDRIEDLIQLNMGKEMRGMAIERYNTCIRVEAVISMNSLFLNGSFMPSDIKDGGMTDGYGRRRIRVLIYEGY